MFVQISEKSIIRKIMYKTHERTPVLMLEEALGATDQTDLYPLDGSFQRRKNEGRSLIYH
jgi:hypothetical protein